MTSTECGWSANFFNFDNYNDSLIQFVDIPADRHETKFELYYLLTMNDPNHDGTYTKLKADVSDVTDGYAVPVVSHTYWGDDPALTCMPRSLKFTGDYAGRTLRVRFTGGPYYSATVIHVRSIALMQTF